MPMVENTENLPAFFGKRTSKDAGLTPASAQKEKGAKRRVSDNGDDIDLEMKG